MKKLPSHTQTASKDRFIRLPYQVRTANRIFSRAATVIVLIAVLVASDVIAGIESVRTWVQLSPSTSPTPRGYLAMTYDGASGKVIMFGGFDAKGYLNDTWSFDGSTWTRVNTLVAPPARANAQMAYDRVTHKVVLFGGYDGTHFLGDTWLWDGAASTWTQATPAHSPPAVTGPMVFPDATGRVDVFGGFNGQFYQLEMWHWQGSDWMQLHPDMVPYARSSAAVGLDSFTNEIVMFGGLADVNPINTWTYDGTTWTLRSPSDQPAWVYGSSSVFDPNIRGVVVFGGGSGGVDQNTTWVWRFSNWQQLVTTQSPGPREGAGIAYDPTLHRVIIFGGQFGDSVLNDTWRFDDRVAPDK
jgi:hypothetical protein